MAAWHTKVTLTFVTEADSKVRRRLAYEIAGQEGFLLGNREIEPVALTLRGSFRRVREQTYRRSSAGEGRPAWRVTACTS